MMIQCGNSVCRFAKLQSLSRAFLGDCAPGHVAVAKKPSAKRAAHLKTCVSAVSQNISEEYQSVEFDFACPICTTTHFKLRQTGGKPTGDLTCPRCQRTFSASSASVDLTLTSGVQQKVYEQRSWGGTEIFRNPLVSLAYERGWRQGFAWAGFPGVDRETEIALEYLKPAYGEVLVDMSCGNVARLPFATGSLAAINASAAIHCWPNPQAALVEISRCLRPGGVFVASTFLSGIAPLGQILGNDDLVRPLRGLEPTTGSYRWWEEDELKDLCTAMGLQGFERERNNRFIMFTVRKPGIHGD
ncbi:hypothetical protein Ndes2437A_g03969 [Nannochloris sp. 'desiccata']